MIAPDLLGILVCPETKQPVQLAEAALVGQLNEKIRRNELLNRAGVQVTEVADGALVRADGKVAYLIREDIPIMLVDEAIQLS